MPSTQGLPIDTFLKTVPWLSHSHCSPQSAQHGTNSCNACTSVSANCCGVDADANQGFITGVARFYTSAHQLVFFAPVSNETDALSDISAVIGVEQGKIRLVLRTSGSTGNVCMTIDEAHIIEAVKTSVEQTVHMIHFTFPFVILEVQSRATVLADSCDARTASARELKRFDSLKEEVNKVREGNMEKKARTPEEDAQQSSSASAPLSEQKPSLENKEGLGLEDVFMNVISKGAHLVMPPCYPYAAGNEVSDGAWNSSEKHIAFAEACMQQESAIRDALKQVDAWVHFARRKRRSVEQSPTKNGAKTQRTSELLNMEGK